jgi:hypothetical protein
MQQAEVLAVRVGVSYHHGEGHGGDQVGELDERVSAPAIEDRGDLAQRRAAGGLIFAFALVGLRVTAEGLTSILLVDPCDGRVVCDAAVEPGDDDAGNVGEGLEGHLYGGQADRLG